MSPHRTHAGLIFDLGDVLFAWSPNTTTSIPPKTMRSIISSPIWKQYECGLITQSTCYRQVAQHFSIPTAEVAEAFSQARDSLQPNSPMIAFLQELKKASRGAIKIYAMSNISKEDFTFLSTKLADWSVFDRVFTSGHAGMRKPDLGFYNHVLEETQLAVEETIFIDDREENVAAAQSLGIRGLIFEDNDTVARALSNLLDDPVERGYDYLDRNAKYFDSVTTTGVKIPDNFAQLLILEATQDHNLVELQWGSRRTWNFFIGNPVLIKHGRFPDDLDTTTLALTVLRPREEIVNSLLDEILGYVHDDGSVQTYFDPKKPRTDFVVAANVLTCFYTFGRGRELDQTLNVVRNVLLQRTYTEGSRYYPSPDCCLYFFGRLLRSSKDLYLQTQLRDLLKKRIKERIGQNGNALDLAMRILTCSALGLTSSIDRRALLEMQAEDGGWETGWIYSYGSTGLKIGNRGVTTAMAIKALLSSEFS